MNGDELEMTTRSSLLKDNNEGMSDGERDTGSGAGSGSGSGTGSRTNSVGSGSQQINSNTLLNGKDTDDKLKRLEENKKWSRWRYMLVIAICIGMRLPDVWQSEALKYQARMPEHHCWLPPGSSMNGTIPWDEDQKTYSSCMVYTQAYNETVLGLTKSRANIARIDSSADSYKNSTMECREAKDEWNYTGEGSESSVVMEFSLVCEEAQMIDSIQWLHLASDLGIIGGVLTLTPFMDLWGRKWPFFISSWVMVIFGLVNAAVNNYRVYLFVRVVTGFLRPCFELAGYLLAVELFSAKQRPEVATIIEDFWGVGMMVLGKLMEWVPEWRNLQIITSVAGLLTIPMIGYIHESIPLLIYRGQYSEVKHITEWTKLDLQLPDNDAVNNRTRCEVFRKNCALTQACSGGKKSSSSSSTTCRARLSQAIQKRWLLLSIILMMGLWYINSLMYYGTSMHMGDMMDTGPMNLMLGGTMELTACSLCFFIIKKWGRKVPLTLFQISAGILLIISQIMLFREGLSSMAMCFGSLSKAVITASFGTVHLYALEVFPTNIRTQCMGLAFVGSALGHITATFTSAQIRAHPLRTAWILGGVSIMFGVVTILSSLPETNRKSLPQNKDEMTCDKRKLRERLCDVLNKKKTTQTSPQYKI